MKIKEVLPEGKYINGFLNYRFSKNKNALICVTGATGSGKTYTCLSICQHWYQYRWNKDFPPENICFNTQEVVNRLKKGNLKKGELLIFEEAGANLGSLEFQTRVSRLFTYILQSFRSMNIGLLMNLPVLTMLNKQARQLLHMHMITKGIDFDKKKTILDCKLHQLNQHSGKSYWKHPQVLIGNKRIKLKELSYSMPPKSLLEIYEKRKADFVNSLVEEYEIKTKSPEEIREREKLEKEKIFEEKRNKILDRYRNEEGKVVCPVCKRQRIHTLKNKISCYACGHVEYFDLE